MRAVFMGTPDIAVGCLEAVAAWADQTLVVTQPDRPRGRRGTPQPSPVKARASELGLEVVQPTRIRGDAEFGVWLAEQAPDVVVVVAFGQILPAEVLQASRLGCVNVHFSLLPKYRGAAPVQWALIRGEVETGITTMLMDEGLDTGPMLLTERVAIDEDEDAGALLERLARLAPRLLTQTLEGLAAGRLSAEPQVHADATLAPRLSREDGKIAWSEPAADVVAQVRGVTPWPGAVAEVAGDEVKILQARVGEGAGEPGAVLAIEREDGLLIAAGQGAVWLRQVQAPGRKPVSGAEYAHGKRLTVE